MARIINNESVYLAAVNRAGYKKDVRRFERKLMIWNLFHMTMYAVAVIAGSNLVLFCTALDDFEHERLVFKVLLISALILAVAILLQKIPRPRLPFGIRLYKGRYVISGFTHPGNDIVEVNTDYVYEDGRKCRVIPCTVKKRRHTSR